MIALLLADPGQDLPGDRLLRADLLVDREEPGRDGPLRQLRGSISAGGARAALADQHGHERRGAGQQERNRYRCRDQDPRVRLRVRTSIVGRSAAVEAAHEPAHGSFSDRQPQRVTSTSAVARTLPGV